MTLVGLLSDTHVPHRMKALPPLLFERLAGVELLLHAGDLDDSTILEQLRRIAPVKAVRGNVHLQALRPNDRRLPLFVDLEINGHRVVVTHGHLSLWNSLWEKFWLFLPDMHGRANRHIVKRLARAFPGADVCVFGHSHQAFIQRRNGTLFVNPGAVCPTRGRTPSVARLRLTRAGTDAEIVPLPAW